MSRTEETGRIYRYKNKNRILKAGSENGEGTGHDGPPPDLMSSPSLQGDGRGW